jgi:GNAT superfamily N-acetyltransferase
MISDDAARFDTDAMHDFLVREAYWARGRGRQETAVAAANSVVLGVYAPDGSMVGGARIVTDRATFGWLADVYVLAEHRGLGLGKALVAAACEHPSAATVKRLMLITADAHELYRPAGFSEPTQPERFMERVPASEAGPGGDAAGGGADGPQGATPATASPAAAGPAAAAGESRAHVAWQGDGLPDPRTAAVGQVASFLLEIVGTEGPVTADRAYRLYIRASGSSKVTQRARAPMEQALGRLKLRGHVEVDELDNAGEVQQVLRMTGTAAVVVRELGDRSLYEAPLNEIAELMGLKRQELLGRAGSGSQPAHAVASVIQQAALRRASPDRLKRAVLDTYGLIRMTQAAEQYLDAALTLLEGDTAPN